MNSTCRGINSPGKNPKPVKREIRKTGKAKQPAIAQSAKMGNRKIKKSQNR